MTAKARWIIAIVGLLVGNVIAMGVLVASARGGAQVIPDYYERALQHDRVIEEANLSSRRGWHVDAELTRDGIAVEVHDASGTPISGRVRVSGYPRARAVNTFDVELHQVGPGRYRAARLNARGWHDLEITIDTPDARDLQRTSAEAP
ncbi:MAG TPA: FixH family protein [Kofleriaceae bacterium]